MIEVGHSEQAPSDQFRASASEVTDEVRDSGKEAAAEAEEAGDEAEEKAAELGGKAKSKAQKAKGVAAKKEKELEGQLERGEQWGSKNRDNPVVVGNAVIVGLGGVLLGYGAYTKYSKGELDAKVIGIWAGMVGLFATGDYFLSKYVFKALASLTPPVRIPPDLLILEGDRTDQTSQVSLREQVPTEMNSRLNVGAAWCSVPFCFVFVFLLSISTFLGQ
ncbi:hypothetical protein MMC25_005787 [Agyrium rufum]|nr:hypothetical protein [Agyrium rufum]